MKLVDLQFYCKRFIFSYIAKNIKHLFADFQDTFPQFFKTLFLYPTKLVPVVYRKDCFTCYRNFVTSIFHFVFSFSHSSILKFVIWLSGKSQGYDRYRLKPQSRSIFNLAHSSWSRGLVIITTAKVHSTMSKLRFYAALHIACCMSEIAMMRTSDNGLGGK